MEQHGHQAILDSIAEAVFTVDLKWNITSFNKAAEKITGVPAYDALGKSCFEVFKTSACSSECPLRKTIESGRQICAKHVYMIGSKGRRIPVSLSTSLLKNEDETIVGGIETFRDMSLVEELRKELEEKYTFADIIGRSPRMSKLFEVVPDLAKSDSTILIEGASGTGKELFARAIHDLSPRRDRRFVAVNCAALPDTLLESELFGYKAGAFTDAKRNKPGKFTLAEGGTIFLDEIGDVSPAMQSRLLRVLQDRTIEPLGSVRSEKTNVRVIAATNKNLSRLVQMGTFREDLYYRVNVFSLSLPLLKDRREDIPLLVDHFISKYNRRRSKDIAGVSEDAMRVLQAYSYPGNVRELENLIEHAFILCHGWFIEPRHLPLHLHQMNLSKQNLVNPSVSSASTLSEWEVVHIIESLQRHEGNKTAAARELGIHPSTLFRKLKALGITLPGPEDDGTEGFSPGID